MTFTPQTFGFDASRFPRYRAGQLDLSFQVAESPHRFTFIQIPPGGGKSLAYMTVPRILSMGADRPLRTLVLVGTRGLQQQLARDFAHAFTIYGHSNYRCRAVDPGGPLAEYADPSGRPTTCDAGPCRIGVDCVLRRGGCDSYDARAQAAGSEVVLANYALWLSLGRYAEPDSLGRFDLLVLDEAHTARDWLAKTCSITLLRHDLKPLGLDLPPASVVEDVSRWEGWASAAAATVRQAVAVAKRVRQLTPRDTAELARLEADLTVLAAVRPDGPTRWVAELTGSRQGPCATFSPVWAHEFAERYLFRGIPRVVLSSATLSPLDARYLGIGEHLYIERPSAFPVERRPFIYVPAVKVRYGMGAGELRMWVNVIDRIIEGRLDRKGIVLPRSYEYARHLVERSKFRTFMLTHRDSTSLRAQLEAFKAAEPPAIFVSPSIDEGFDFPDDDSRYTIIGKVPFPDMRDALTRARMEEDKVYSLLVTAQTILQQYGRGVRSEEDWGETFMTDENWQWFSAAASKQGLWPAYFRAAWQRADMPPAPPPLALAPTSR